MMDDYDPPDEFYEEQHKRKLRNMLRHLPPDHPDAGDIQDALEEMDDD